MAAALLPVLMLGAVQTAVAFNREAEILRESLGSAAQRSAARLSGASRPASTARAASSVSPTAVTA